MVGRLLRVTGTVLVIAVACVTPVLATATATPAAADTVINGCTIVSNPTPTNFTNCPGANLSGANLSGLNLSYANFAGANLAESFDAVADFSDANLFSANLSDLSSTVACTGITPIPECSSADFSGATLTDANVANASLASCQTVSTRFGLLTVCNGAEFSGANLSGANFTGATLGLPPGAACGLLFCRGADFSGTLLVPSNQTVIATNSAGAVGTWPTPQSLPGATPGSCTTASGSTFPAGTTTVTCQVLDDQGDVATGSFTVTVNPPPPPSTSVLLPSNGATVSGSTWLDAGASSPVGIASVTFEVSGGSISDKVVSPSGATLYGYIGAWDTTDVPNGTYNLQSVATDTLGQSSTSAPIAVTVNNPPPTTSVLIPSPGATQSGTAALVDASASAKVSSVSFELSGGTLSDHVVATATPTLYGWLAQWNTTTVPNGTYTLQSVATYVGGVSGTSPGVTITVNNPPPTTSVLIPSNGASQSGTAALLDASASPGVTSVTYELTGGTLSDQPIATGTPTYYGWLAQWNTKTVPNGTYSLISVAAYAGGVSGTSTAITITVSN